MKTRRYYHKCPKCGKRRLCRGVYGPLGTDIHEIACTPQCRGLHGKDGVNIRCMAQEKGAKR